MKFNKHETERIIQKWEKMTHGVEKGRVSKTDRCIRMSEGQWITLSSVCSRILGSQNNLRYYLITIKLTNQYEGCFIFFIQTAQSRLESRQKISFLGLQVLLPGLWNLKDIRLKIRAKTVLKLNWSVKAPWHEHIEVARSGLWAPVRC